MRASNIISSVFCSALLFGNGICGTKPPKCGEVNVFYTGLPPYHKDVIAQGYDPAAVAAAIKNSTIEMIEAGYNVRIVLAGPEQDMSLTANRMKGRRWPLTGIGYGLRAAKSEELITQFEDQLILFRKQGPNSITVFNYDPSSFLWSLQRRLPLASDCVGSPGKDLGTYIFCDEMSLVEEVAVAVTPDEDRTPQKEQSTQIPASVISAFDLCVELQLGDVLTNPFSEELVALNRKCRIAIDPEDYVPMSREGGFKSTRQQLLAGRLGVWASFLATAGIGPNVNIGASWDSSSDDSIEAAETETRRFHVTDNYVKRVLLSPMVAEHLSEFPRANLWMISGLKVVRGAKMNAGNSIDLSADIGTGNKLSSSDLKFLKLLWSRANQTSFQESSDFILAVQLRHIKLKAGKLKKVSLSTKNASMADGSAGVLEADLVGAEYVGTDNSITDATIKFYNQLENKKDRNGHDLFMPDLNGDLDEYE
ncbi:hypothetical protein HJFPF1_10661 [Paramyrothecium foliicola]|nr:hypothetical protein HJFPF1_10661 [Paramyrothecium foliicola]